MGRGLSLATLLGFVETTALDAAEETEAEGSYVSTSEVWYGIHSVVSLVRNTLQHIEDKDDDLPVVSGLEGTGA